MEPAQVGGGSKFRSLPHPPSLLSSAHHGQRRRVLDVTGGGEEEVGLLVENLLTPDECAFYVRHLDEAGMQPLAAGSTSSSSASASGEGEFPAHYRTSDRLLTLSPDAARALFERLLPCLRPSDAVGVPMGPGTEGVWLPVGLNECLKFARYYPGGHFSAHIDGPWVPSAKRASMFTVVIYLNDARSQPPCVGGHTNFLRPAIITPQAQRITESAAAESHIARSQQEHNVVYSVEPKTGSAVVFRHELLHEGAPLLSGVKYILRTELIFERVDSALTPRSISPEEELAWTRIVSLYELSESLYRDRDSTGFVEAYLEALELQRSFTPSASAGRATLPFSVLERVVSCLDDPGDVLRVMRASRALYRLGRMNPVWQHFATNAAASSSSLATEKKSWNADWYGLCRRMVADGRRKAQLPRNRHIEGGNESFGSEHHCKGVELAHRWQTRSGPMLPSALTMGDVNAGIRPPAIVIDSGTLNTKVGFGGEEKPRATFPTIVGRQRHCHSFTPKVYTGDVALQRGGHLTCRFPIEKRVVTNWDDMELIWTHAFAELSVQPMDHPVLNLEPIAQSRASREKATQIMLETFNVPAYCSVAQPVAALMANGLKTGLVVDVGENVIDVAPVYQGHCLQYAAQRLEIARGHGLTGVLRALLNENREPNQRLRTTSESQKVRQAKEALCFTSLNFEDDMRIADMQQNTVRDPVPELFGNIVFAGGSSAMPGFGQRLQHEVQLLSPPGVCVRVMSRADPLLATWQGGAAFASHTAFDDAWLTSQQYDEYGPPQIDWVCY